MMDVLNMILPMIASQPKIKNAIEQIFNQPSDHVINAVSKFMDDVKKGPGIQNSDAEKAAMFNRYYQGGLAMGFTDWESEIAAAALAGYTPMDVCLSFRNNRKWSNTTVEKIESLVDRISPKFIERGKECGLIPKEVAPDSAIPPMDVTTAGGVPPWEMEGYQLDAADKSK